MKPRSYSWLRLGLAGRSRVVPSPSTSVDAAVIWGHRCVCVCVDHVGPLERGPKLNVRSIVLAVGCVQFEMAVGSSGIGK